nr:immunoglobulin light chain junction region [Macaca mulatta]
DYYYSAWDSSLNTLF